MIETYSTKYILSFFCIQVQFFFMVLSYLATLQLLYILRANIMLLIPLHLFNNFIYKQLWTLNAASEPV